MFRSRRTTAGAAAIALGAAAIALMVAMVASACTRDNPRAGASAFADASAFGTTDGAATTRGGGGSIDGSGAVVDGSPDIGCPTPAVRACYTGSAKTRGIGSCKSGTQDCAAGAWGPCAGEVLPVAEICDGRDNDCDGKPDDGLKFTNYFRDADGDAFGDPKTKKKRCAAEKGWVTNGDDCWDGSVNAHPIQRGFYQNHRGDGNFDFNCDKKQEQQWPKAHECSGRHASCTDRSGWVGGVPGCGKTGAWIECRSYFGFCSGSGGAGARTQKCR